MKRVLISLILIMAISAYAEMTPWEVKFKTYTKGLPQDVVDLLSRTDGCNHFGGEEPYDEARKKQIIEATQKLKCDALEADTKLLNKKYTKQPIIIKKIKNFSVLD